MLRRFISEGERIDSYICENMMFIADWCNVCLRKILEYKILGELSDFGLDKINTS